MASGLAMVVVLLGVGLCPWVSGAASGSENCTVGDLTVASGGFVCVNGTLHHCSDGVHSATNESCGVNCTYLGVDVLPNHFVCENGTLHACNISSGELYSTNESCTFVSSTGAKANCTSEGSVVLPWVEVCRNDTLYACNGTTGELYPTNQTCPAEASPPTLVCEYLNHGYVNGDFICEKGANLRCVKSEFRAVGSCSAPQWVNCSYLKQPCANAYSSELQTSLVYCGPNGNFNSAKSLCYPDSGEYYCSNNYLGTKQDWIIRSPGASHFGFPCPRR